MPGTEVAIGWNSPASLVPGFMSNVSFWLGPPSIHSKMHDLCLTPNPAACAAIRSNQPDIEVRAAPAAENLRKSRRDSSTIRELVIRGLPGNARRLHAAQPASRWLMIQSKLTGIQQGPEDIVVSLRRIALVGLKVFLQTLVFGSRGTAGQGGQEEPLDVSRRRLVGLDRLADEGRYLGRPFRVHQPQDLGDAGGVLVRVGPFAGAEEVHETGTRAGRRALGFLALALFRTLGSSQDRGQGIEQLFRRQWLDRHGSVDNFRVRRFTRL